MLENRDTRDSQEDIKAIGDVVLECLDPKAFLQRGSLSDKWTSDIFSFVESTKVDSAAKLLKV
jgi:hypothetical protein